MCFSSVNGFLGVLCHGTDGHFALEAAIHTHCVLDCGQTANNSNTETATGLCFAHPHCKDSIATLNAFNPNSQKNSSSHNLFTLNLVLKPILARTSSFSSRFFVNNDSLSSFYTPLQTVVLLV
jgi:hypothetical protein